MALRTDVVIITFNTTTQQRVDTSKNEKGETIRSEEERLLGMSRKQLIASGYDIHRMASREEAGQPVVISGVTFDGSDAPPGMRQILSLAASLILTAMWSITRSSTQSLAI